MSQPIRVEIMERRQVELPLEEAKRVAIERIRVACDLREGAYIKEGNLVYIQEDRGGSHSSFETITIRKAMPLDEAAMEVIRAINRRRATALSHCS